MLEYRYIKKDGILILQMTDDPGDPEDFSKPCNCQTCFRKTVRLCRRLKIGYREFGNVEVVFWTNAGTLIHK